MNLRLLIGVSFFLLAGCGGRLVPVEGQLLLDGKPLAGAAITFLPEEKSLEPDAPQRAQTVSGSEGRFRLNTGNDKGVVPGDYKVTVVKMEYPPEYYQSDAAKDGMDAVAALAGKGKHVVAERFRKEVSTPLKVQILAEGTQDLRLEVESK